MSDKTRMKYLWLAFVFSSTCALAEDIRSWKQKHCFLCQVDSSGHLLVPMYKSENSYYRMRVIRADKEHISLKMVGLSNRRGDPFQRDMNFGTEREREGFLSSLKGICRYYFSKNFSYYASGATFTKGSYRSHPEEVTRGQIELSCVVDKKPESWGQWIKSMLGSNPAEVQDDRSSGKILVMPVAPSEHSPRARRY